MKISSPIDCIPFAFACLLVPISAQNSFNRELIIGNQPVMSKAVATIPDSKLLIQNQEFTAAAPLDSRSMDMDMIVDADLLRQPSIYRKVSIAGRSDSLETPQKILGERLALLSATYRAPATPVGNDGCDGIAKSISQRLRIKPESLLETVEAEIMANPSCTCEIVKSAIEVSYADPDLVIGIVEAAINAAPQYIRLISQCALASAPDSLVEIQKLLAKLDTNAGESSPSAKSSKSSIDAVHADTADQKSANPLDRLLLELTPPLPIHPPYVTDVNPTVASRRQ